MRMGILDDAIREHLELKRRHGAANEDLDRLEKEAFGPPSRPGDPEFQTGEEPLSESRGEGMGAGSQSGEPEFSEQPTTAAPQAAAPAAKAESAPAAAAESRAESGPEAAAPPEAPEHAIFDVEDEDEDEDDFPGPVAEAREAADAGATQPAAEPPDEPEAASAPVAAEVESGSRQEDPDEVRPPAAEAPAPHDEPPSTADEPPPTEERPLPDPDAGGAAEPGPAPGRAPDLFEDDEDAPPAPIEDRRGETAEWEDAAVARDEEPGGRDADEDSDRDEDLLEETPEFLRDAPEGERLWFEQGSPRDFDFDDD